MGDGQKRTVCPRGGGFVGSLFGAMGGWVRVGGVDVSLLNQKWPAKSPEKLQLYSMATPNGVKVSIMLEEVGLPYEAHFVDITRNETFTPEFLSLNPNGKIPAIVDPQGPDGGPFGLWESGAILYYLARKTGELLPKDPGLAYETLQWVFFQMAGVGPILGQMGYFHRFAGKELEDKRPLQRYVKESKRLLDVVETRLGEGDWVMGDEYTIADVSLIGWVAAVDGFYQAGELLESASRPRIQAWVKRMMERPAVQRGRSVPARPES